MAVEKQEQEPTLEPTLHAVAKPVTRGLAWAAVAAGTAALALAAARTARTGD